MDELQQRAARHAALGEPQRLAIVDELSRSDRSPSELQSIVGLPSNLLAHHLDVLEAVGLISRHRSSGDGRKRYVRLERGELRALNPGRALKPTKALFVCTHNSARSQMAAAIWKQRTGHDSISAGTHPASAVHPGAIAAAKRIGLDLTDQVPRHLDELRSRPSLVITVCDQAHEELGDSDHLHWSIPDPVRTGGRRAFDSARDEIAERIAQLTANEADQ